MASNKSQYEIALEIGGKIQASFGQSINNANSGLNSLTRTVKNIAKVVTATFATAKVVDFIQDSTEAAKNYESAMAGVAKAVDGLKDENGALTESYYEMHDAILDLSKEIPMTADAIAEITASAGQANIPKDDLLEFTETAAKMGIAFDSSAEQAGEWMAAWRTALDLNQDEVTSLADKINYLGNTSSESAIKLSEVVTTVGSLAKTAGMSGEEVAAIAAAMTKVDSAVSATGIKNMITALTAGSSATKRQQGALKSLNLDAVQLAETMQKDAQGAILSVLEAIQKLPKAEQASVLKNYFGKESLSSIAPLLANLDNLKEQFNKVGDASLYAGSMEKEYQSVSATTANAVQLAKNRIEAAKITLGETFLPLVGDGADIVSKFSERFAEFAERNGPKFNEAIQKAKQYIKEISPTVIKTLSSIGDGFKTAWEYIAPFASWVIKNPDKIAKFIIGIAVAIKTYKTVDHIQNLTKGFKSLSIILTNPWALAIGAVAGAITGIGLAIYDANKKAKKASLAEHFGDISLSLEEIEDVSKRIINNKYFDQMDTMMSEFAKSSTYVENVKEATNELNKMNWKVSIGLDLSENEIAEYQTQLHNFTESVQSYVTQEGYSVSLAVGLLLGDNSATDEGKGVLAYYDSYYTGIYTQIDELSEELSDYFTKAVKEGLTIDKIEVINNLQNQIADITESLSISEFDANMQVLNLKYSGVSLTSDTAMMINEELGEYTNNAIEGYEKALSKALIAPTHELSNGKISQDEYNNIVNPLYEGFISQVENAVMRAYEFQINTLMDTYGDELANFNEMSDADKNAIREVVKSFSTTYEQLIWVAKMSNETNREVSMDIEESIKTLGLLQQALGNEDFLGIFDMTPKPLKDIEEMAGTKVSEVFTNMQNKTDVFSEEFINSLNVSLSERYPELNLQGIYAGAEVVSGVKAELSKPIMLTLPIDLTIDYNIVGNTKPLGVIPEGSAAWSEKGWQEYHDNNRIINLPGHADGGIFDRPHVAWFAEEGPEAAIPLDKSDRSIGLWEATGRLLGVLDNGLSTSYDKRIYDRITSNTTNNTTTNKDESTDNMKFTYSPVVNLYGNADQKDIERALSISKEDFRELMEEYEREKDRMS